ncbi:chromate transporter [Ectobacillus ponti]|uniref:Chromate transporter n=1 Tax=Ectobacillus ponti TaxID=2961894 RepID=A0AA41XE12_9BACI|nr:chromate transporter [Ectobacillus ponti]MCP8970381.1 chromate transporter [Ectobacillus ponti]
MEVSQGKQLLELFWSFCKIGPVTFGGGYAMLPAIEREIVEKKGWLTEEEMAEVISISGAAPGGIGVNAAACIGHKLLGWKGIAAAVTGIMLPTFLFVLLLAVGFSHFQHHPKVMAALKGIQVGVIALIAYAGIRMIRTTILDKTTVTTFFVTLGLLLFLGMPPLLVIVLGGCAGVVLVKVKEAKGYPVFREKEANAEQSEQVPQDYYFGEGI